MRKYKNNIIDSKELQKSLVSNLGNVAKDTRKRNVIIAMVVLACCIIYLLSANWDAKKTGVISAPVNISVSKVIAEDVPNAVSLVGTVYAYETVAIKSRIDSQVTVVHFKDGNVVKEGDVLFELDNSILAAQLNQYTANLKRDEAQLENSRTQYERYLKLSKKGFASGEKMEEASAAFKTQIAAVNATKASIDSIKAQIDFTKITAPISGRVGTINVTRGNTVKANDTQPLVIINRVKPILVQFAIPQRYYDALRQAGDGGVEVTAQRSSGGQAICVGKLEYIDNMIDSSTGAFNARAVFENADENLWPGMFVNISILLNIDKNALVIPQVAVQNGQEGTFVFVVDEAGKKAVKKPVEVLRMQDDKAIIKNGLQVGESVVVDGLLKLSDGSLIEISVPSENSGDKATSEGK